MSYSFTCLIFASFLYFLIVYVVNFAKRKKKFASNEAQKDSINFHKDTTGTHSEKQNCTCTDDTDKSRVNCFEMSAIDGVGLVTHVGSKFEWEINKFSSNCKEVGDFILSPELVTTLSKNNSIEWRLKLYPKGVSAEVQDHLSLYIECLTIGKVVAEIVLSILNKERSRMWEWKMNKTFDNQKSWGYAKLVQRHSIIDQNNRVLSNDTLTIFCELILHSNPSNQLYIDYKLEPFNDFENLLETGNGSDVTIRVDGIEIKAHKAFLISRSPVFQAMFECEMKEKEENVVEILDFRYHIVKELLRFIYSSKVNNIQNHARALLAASDKYCIRGLKVLCEHDLSGRIKFKNAFQLLEFATTYNADFLKSQIILFITKNKHSIVDRPEFKKFLVDFNADIVCEIFRSVVKSR